MALAVATCAKIAPAIYSLLSTRSASDNALLATAPKGKGASRGDDDRPFWLVIIVRPGSYHNVAWSYGLGISVVGTGPDSSLPREGLVGTDGRASP